MTVVKSSKPQNRFNSAFIAVTTTSESDMMAMPPGFNREQAGV
jgi:hypothetical protein